MLTHQVAVATDVIRHRGTNGTLTGQVGKVLCRAGEASSAAATAASAPFGRCERQPYSKPRLPYYETFVRNASSEMLYEPQRQVALNVHSLARFAPLMHALLLPTQTMYTRPFG
jgi:hypothetical protein